MKSQSEMEVVRDDLSRQESTFVPENEREVESPMMSTPSASSTSSSSSSTILRVDGDGHLVGNFPNYYAFHPVEQRMSFISEGYWLELWDALDRPERLLILDVGCNEGDLSLAMYKMACGELSGEKCTVKLLGVDIDEMLIERASKKCHELEQDVVFLAMDFMTHSGEADMRLGEYLRALGATSFDFISLFSITMWIHINYVSFSLRKTTLSGAKLINHSLLTRVMRVYKNLS